MQLEPRRTMSTDGFTLVELLIVLVIIGIMIAIAVPSYLGFRERANAAAAAANVRSAVPAVETFYSDHQTYAAMDITALEAIDPGVKLSAVSGVGAATYCISSTVGARTWRKEDPGGVIAEGVTC